MLGGCDKTDPENTAVKQSEQAIGLEIQWQENLGEWILKARKAHKTEERWVLEELNGLLQLSEEPNQLTLKIKQSELDLKTFDLSGTEIDLEHPAWQLKGTSFSSTPPLEVWILTSVSAQFHRGETSP